MGTIMATIEQKIREGFEKGWTYRKIAKHAGVISTNTVAYHLDRMGLKKTRLESKSKKELIQMLKDMGVN